MKSVNNLPEALKKEGEVKEIANSIDHCASLAVSFPEVGYVVTKGKDAHNLFTARVAFRSLPREQKHSKLIS
jgi:hypothetical protein